MHLVSNVHTLVSSDECVHHQGSVDSIAVTTTVMSATTRSGGTKLGRGSPIFHKVLRLNRTRGCGEAATHIMFDETILREVLTQVTP